MCEFCEKNEVPKVKIPKFATGGICNDAIPKLDAFSQIDEIVKDITKKKDNAMAMEFTKCIGELLRNNGVVPKIKQYGCDFYGENSFQSKFGVIIDELDFSEHDKVFEDKIASLEKQIERLMREKQLAYDRSEQLMKTADILNSANKELKQRIAELESKETEICGKEPKISDSAPSREWYENRHQSDCIEINRLNTTIDVLMHKVEYLRQFAGLE